MTGVAWRLRAAGADDADRLSLVAAATFLQTFAGTLAGDDLLAHCRSKLSPAAFAASVTQRGTRATLAEHAAGAAPIGYAIVTRCDLPLAGEDDRELLRLYILASFHGGGLGRAMMARAIDEARADGAARLLLGVYHGNARARRFYEREGFRVIGERPFQVGTVTHHDPVYALNL